MSRTEGSFKISGALEPRIASALDARTLVQTKAELTASGNFPYPYVGLEVYVISENKKYRFIGSDTTDINDWEEVGSGGRVTGFTPIGTIIPMIAESAPLYYLKCDGATYNKSDYPELAAHLLSMTNHSMYEVSGDDTKFKVPDLRGEFLRGTGTNGHANQGNGAAVGIHQDSTAVRAEFLLNTGVDVGLYIGHLNKDNAAEKIVSNVDSSYGSASTTTYVTDVFQRYNQTARTDGRKTHETIRPTTTSVLYCIATKDIYIDTRNLYSTTEKVVGEWISGETLYQKTYTFEFTSSNPTSISLDLPTNMKDIISFDGAMKSTAGASGYGYYFPISFLNVNDASNNSLVTAYLSGGTGKIIVACGQDRSGFSCWLTIQYTKATT